MTVRTSESVTLAATPGAVFPIVADLSTYPRWLPLVHEATRVPAAVADRPAWNVELSARVGPFARSKRLRMERVEVLADELAVFERVEVDGREHARWSLRVELAVAPPNGTVVAQTVVTMHLRYDGRLWTGGLLESVLDEQIRRGREGLAALVSGDATP